MKVMILVLGILLSQSVLAATTNCDVAKSARQAVKAIVAIEDIKGITAYYGSVSSDNPDIASVNVQPAYQTTKDWFVVKVRTKDCRVMDLELKAENISIW